MITTKDITVDVEVDPTDFSTEDLMDALESRGYIVLHVDDETPDKIKDMIHSIKEDFLSWHLLGMSNENFEKSMKQFFLDTINEYIS